MNLFTSILLDSDIAEVSENAVEAVSGNTVSDNIIDQVIDGTLDINQQVSAFSSFMQSLPEKLMRFGIKFLIAILLFVIGAKVINVVRKLVRKSLDIRDAETGVKQFLDSLIKVCLYFVLVVWIASYYGFQTTSLIALLGSAGVTLALALQGSLSNVTGGILILILKPFKVGDYIKEDNKGNEGTVVEIQLFYTRLRTVDDKIVILPNGTLANTSMTNINASPLRRVNIKVGISYSSNIEKAKKVILDAINANESVKKEKPVKVVVDSLDSSQVTISSMFFVENDEYFDVKWLLTEKIKIELDKNNIEIPFNQLDVHVSNK